MRPNWFQWSVTCWFPCLIVSCLLLAMFSISVSPNCVLRASTNSNQIVHVAVRLPSTYCVIHFEAAFRSNDLVYVIRDWSLVVLVASKYSFHWTIKLLNSDLSPSSVGGLSILTLVSCRECPTRSKIVLNCSSLNPAIEKEFVCLVRLLIVFLLAAWAGVEPTDPVWNGASGDTGLGTRYDPCLESATASTRASPKSLIGSSISWYSVVSSGVVVKTRPNVMVPCIYVVQQAMTITLN